MKKSLESKIQVAENELLNKLEKGYNIELSTSNGTAKNFLNLLENLKEWFSDEDEKKISQEPIDSLVNSYFHDKDTTFEFLLKDQLIASIKTKNLYEMKRHLNEIAQAIAKEKVKIKVLALLINSNTNS